MKIRSLACLMIGCLLTVGGRAAMADRPQWYTTYVGLVEGCPLSSIINQADSYRPGEKSPMSVPILTPPSQGHLDPEEVEKFASYLKPIENCGVVIIVHADDGLRTTASQKQAASRASILSRALERQGYPRQNLTVIPR